jgi:hypothetical protein
MVIACVCSMAISAYALHYVWYELGPVFSARGEAGFGPMVLTMAAAATVPFCAIFFVLSILSRRLEDPSP